MKYPQLVPSWTCRTPIHVELNREGVSEDGEPLLCLTADLMCNWQDSAKIVRTGEKQYTQLSGVAVFPGDIAPDLAVICMWGTVSFPATAPASDRPART